MKPYAIYRPGLTEKENAQLDHLIREMAELRSVSLWCFYHVNEWKIEQRMKSRAA